MNTPRRSSLSAMLGIGKGSPTKESPGGKKKMKSSMVIVAPKARVVDIPCGPVGVEFYGNSVPPKISRVDEASPLVSLLRVDETVISFVRPGLEPVDCAHVSGKDLVFALNAFKEVPGRSVCIGQPKCSHLLIQPGAEFTANLPPGRLGVAFVSAEIHTVNADSVLFGKVQTRDVLLAVDDEPLPSTDTNEIIAFLSDKDDGVLHRTLTLRRGAPAPPNKTNGKGGTSIRLGYVDTKLSDDRRRLSNVGTEEVPDEVRSPEPVPSIVVRDSKGGIVGTDLNQSPVVVRYQS